MSRTTGAHRPEIKTKLPGSGNYHRIYSMVVAAIVALETAGEHGNAILVLRQWNDFKSVKDLMTYLDAFVYIDLLPEDENDK